MFLAHRIVQNLRAGGLAEWVSQVILSAQLIVAQQKVYIQAVYTLDISSAVAAEAVCGQQILDPGRHLIVLTGDGHSRGVAIRHLCMQQDISRLQKGGPIFSAPYQLDFLPKHEMPLIWHGQIS